jgi:c(7)-type cytochrome triheme protein
MDDCARCHPPATGKPQPPELSVVKDSVTATFSHARHAARSAAGKDCTTCHAAIRATDDSELPRPTVRECAPCHDGKTAFATTVACTRCHDRVAAPFAVSRPAARFEHAGPHAEVVGKTPCATCHPIVGGEVRVAGHAPCAGCHAHADDFGAREPKICGACHNATEPWRHLVADRAPPERSELGAALDHGKHLGACDRCHQLRTEGMPHGHVACGCHTSAGGPAPRLTACDGCHQLGLAAARLRARADDPWSVRTAFDHAAHSASACSACHTDLGKGADLVAMPVPAKSTCAPCHDGQRAFKLTGTGCTRCHVGKAAP